MTFIASGAADNNQYFFMDRYIGGDGHMKEWVYVTTDARNTVTAAGYFSTWRGAQPRPGDLLRIYTVSDLESLATTISVCVVAVVVWNVSYIEPAFSANVRIPDGYSLNVDATGSGESADLFLTGDTGQGAWVFFRKNEELRWYVGNTEGSEAGADAGSDLEIGAYSDAEALLTRALLITRATGAVTLTVAPSITTVAAHADDAAAAIGGIPVGGLYRTASALKIRVA